MGMKLQTKLAFYNAFSKIVIILTIGFTLPKLIEHVVYNHIDAKLYAKKDKILKLIKKGGLSEITLDEDCSFGNYNLLKEEYIAVEPLGYKAHVVKIENTERNIEGEIVTHRVISQPFVYDNQNYMLEIGEGLSAIQELNTVIKDFTVIVFLIAISISILLDIGFTKLTLEPLNRIIQTKLKDVNHPTAFDVTPVKTNTEDFNYLDQSINEMMLKIKDAFLIEKEFIANVSHELLTPIAILKNRLENILTDNEVSDAVAVKIVDSQKTLNRLTKIIKALLLISKIENDQFAKPDAVIIKDIVNEVLTDIEERFTDKEISIITDFEDLFEFHYANRDLLYNMFFNIINNAIKYNKTQGNITIKGYHGYNNYIVEITDTGIGISDENLQHIFDRFKRFTNNDNESYGLGLPIVKTIAGFHNIHIEVDSQVNEGTIFKLFFNKI